MSWWRRALGRPPKTNNHLAVVNQSSLSDAEVGAWVAACRVQLKHLQAIWGGYLEGPWSISMFNDFAKVPEWYSHEVVVADDATWETTNLAEHGLRNGKVFGRVYVDRYNPRYYPASIGLSHEVLEICLNPYLTNLVEVGGELWLREIADPVQSVSYEISARPARWKPPQGVFVSDFVTPAWFGLDSPVARFSFTGKCTGMLNYSLGYAIVQNAETGRWEFLGSAPVYDLLGRGHSFISMANGKATT